MRRAECLVCGESAHGVHFGVLACRACAAFFRRTVVQRLKYACRENDDCVINKSDHSMCRSCRYKKCLALGMDTSGVQTNRDSIGPRSASVVAASSSSKTRASSAKKRNGAERKDDREETKPMASSSSNNVHSTLNKSDSMASSFNSSLNLNTPNPSSLTVPFDNGCSSTSASPRTTSSKLRSQIDEIFRQTPSDDLCNVPNMGLLYKMLLAYRRFHDRRTYVYKERGLPERNRCPRKRQLTGLVEKYRNELHVEALIIDMCIAAEFAMTLESFRALPLDQKFAVFKHFWARYITLYRLSQKYAAEYAEYEQNGRQAVVRDHGDSPLEELRMRTLIIPLYQLKPNDIELMAMVGNLLWNVAAREGISNETLDIASEQRRRVYDELHAHYIGERPHALLSLYGEPTVLPNYAMRVILMSDIVNALDRGISQTKEDFNVLRLFDDAMGIPENAIELLELLD